MQIAGSHQNLFVWPYEPSTLKKMPFNRHFSRPAETDPYGTAGKAREGVSSVYHVVFVDTVYCPGLGLGGFITAL